MEWIKVSDRLPEKNAEVLFYIKNCGPFVGSFREWPPNKKLYWAGQTYDCYSLNFEPENVTYWMPLPSNPKE